jgi:hypothetical protein
VALEEIHNLVTLPFQIRIHVPDRCETMEVLWVVLAQKVDNEVNAVWRLLLLNLL